MKRNKDKRPVPNQLKNQATPNVLRSMGAGKSNRAARGDEDLELDELDEDEEFEDEEEEEELEDEKRPRSAAERAAALQAELERQAEEFGLTSLDVTGLYGPNGEAVADLLESLEEIDDDTAEAIADAYEAVPKAERKVAQSVISRRHRGGKLFMELEAAERGVADWLSSLGLEDEGEEALYTVVAHAAKDAVDALVLEDDLDEADFFTLYSPWSEVMDTEEGEDEEAESEAEADEGAAEPEARRKAATADEADKGEAAEEAEEGEFGPNTALVIDLLTRLDALSAADTADLVATWREQPKADLKAAHRALQSLAEEDETFREQMRLAQEEVFGWMDGGASKYLERSFAAGSEARLRESAGPAVADAVAAQGA